MAQHPAPHFIHGACNRKAECMPVSRTMALDHNAAESEQARPIVAAMIDAALEGADHRQGDKSREFTEKVSPQFLAQVMRKHLRHALRGFQCNIANEAIAHNHIRRSFIDVVTLDIPVEIKSAVT